MGSANDAMMSDYCAQGFKLQMKYHRWFKFHSFRIEKQMCGRGFRGSARTNGVSDDKVKNWKVSTLSVTATNINIWN